MRDYRAPKGWIHMGTNDMAFGNTETKQERVRREQKFDNAIRSMKPLEYEYDMAKGEIAPTGLKKEGDAAAVAKKIRKDNLMTAFEEKKLKSKSLIREAQGYNKKNNQQKSKKAN
jgi:hypothetical protein